MPQSNHQNQDTPAHLGHIQTDWYLPLTPGLSLPTATPANALAPECLNRGFAATHVPFIPPTPQKINPWLAALAAQDIRTTLDQSRPFTVIWVPKAAAARAQTELDAYEHVNANWPRHRENSEQHQPICSDEAFCVFLLLQAAMLKFFLWLNQTGQANAWKQRGAWNPQAIANGEWWRCLTALTLHADLPHVTANTLWGFMLGCLAGTRIGSGYAFLLMTAAGALGNATMFWLGSQHQSIGESTMIFALLGILAAQFSVRAWKQREQGKGLIRLIPAVPLACAVAMTALYGAAPGADALAHLAGFAWGLALGTIPDHTPTLTRDVKAQTAMGTAALAVLTIPWYLAWT